MMDLLADFSIRGFTPMTAGGKTDMERKERLRDKLFLKLSDLEEIKNRTRGKRLSVSVHFYLFNDPNQYTRYEKDIDNMLKIFCDVLPDYMDQDKKFEGLGIIEKKNDHLIFEVYAHKTLVDDESEEGMDIQIKEFTKSENS